ncbi:MAG: hypothetical protein NTW21_43190 [Verrucomicrobia bacterium]|nr:hypothetical protein [Verrucomicrobiota bacterium]
MKLLLGTIIALLLAALVMSWNGMQLGVKNTPADEIERLSKQIDALREDQHRIALEKQLLQTNAALAVPVAPPTTTSDELEAMKLQVKENREKLAAMAEEKTKAERDAKVSDSENLELVRDGLEKSNSLAREARLISQALMVGKVKEYVEDAQYGGFATLEVLLPEQVQQNTILAIRRNTGILGQLKITSIEGTEAVASPLPGFGTIPPKPGDELILPPRF